MSASDVFKRLGCPLKSVRMSWAARSPDSQRVAFTLWADEVDWKQLSYVVHPTRDRRPRPKGFEDADDRFGSKEMREIAESALANGAECFGVLIKPVDPEASPREREWVEERDVFRLELARDDERIVARLTWRGPLADVEKKVTR